MKTLYAIVTVQALTIVALAGSIFYFNTTIQERTVILNNQGEVLRVLVNIPEINALIVREIQKAQEAQGAP